MNDPKPRLTLRDFQRATTDQPFRAFLTSQYGVKEADLPSFAGDFSDVKGGASTPTLSAADMSARRYQGAAQAEADLGTAMIQGATANFGDEAVGLISPGLKQAMRDRQDAMRRDHPGTEFAGELVGTVLNPLSRLALPSKGTGLLAKIGQGAAGGAALGGLNAAGSAEGSLSDRLPAAGVGAVTGGVLGGAIPAVGGALKVPGAAKGMAGNAILRLLGVPPGARQAASILRKLAAEGGEVAGTAAKAAEDIPFQPEAPMGRASSPDAMAAVRDYQAGKISGEDLRTALDVAGGRTPARLDLPDVAPTTAISTVARATAPIGSPSELVDRLPADMQTGRGGPGTRVAPTPSASPSELVDRLPPEMQTSRGTYKVGDTQFGAKVVEPGPYQKAAPGTRMDSRELSPPSRMAERLAADPDALAAQLELLRSLGQTEPNARMVEEIARAMAARSVP